MPDTGRTAAKNTGRTAAKTVVLLSGGLDSATCLALSLSQGYEAYPLSFRYGQRHVRELEAARALSRFYDIPEQRHPIMDLLGNLRGSALTGELDVPTGRTAAEMTAAIPSTYVPARNIVFLAFAASFAEQLGAQDIFIGANVIDYSGYPDCRPEFISAFTTMLNLGTRAGAERRPFRIHTPLMRLGKADIIRLGQAMGVPYHLTYSCYLGGDPPCGVCDACLLRLRGFREAGFTDPLAYAPVKEEPTGV